MLRGPVSRVSKLRGQRQWSHHQGGQGKGSNANTLCLAKGIAPWRAIGGSRDLGCWRAWLALFRGWAGLGGWLRGGLGDKLQIRLGIHLKGWLGIRLAEGLSIKGIQAEGLAGLAACSGAGVEAVSDVD